MNHSLRSEVRATTIVRLRGTQRPRVLEYAAALGLSASEANNEILGKAPIEELLQEALGRRYGKDAALAWSNMRGAFRKAVATDRLEDFRQEVVELIERMKQTRRSPPARKP